MKHDMKLLPVPFEAIQQGNKTVEVRLYDQKRQQVNIGDEIEFSKLPACQERLATTVTSVDRYATFSQLYDKHSSQLRRQSKEAFLEGCYQIYAKEQEKKYGVVAIGLTL